MRDPKRIHRILALLELCWRESPDLRLMQLLHNVAPPFLVGDPYYLEDDELEQILAGYHDEACPNRV